LNWGATVDEESLTPVPIPPLIDLLVALEQRKGSELTRAEVEEARDNSICMMMRVSVRDALQAKRGYRDIDLENVWEEWLALPQAAKS
jgi:hypothetical protein